MKKLRQRITAWVMVGAMFAASMQTNILAADYSAHWAKDAIGRWTENNIIRGYEDGTFRPNHQVTRAEMAAFLVRVFGYTDQKDAVEYTDVKTGAWYTETIATISSANVMHLEGSTFKPNQYVTREEAVYAIATAYKVTGAGGKVFNDASNISEWAKEAVDAMVANGYICGYENNSFLPQGKVTRAELVTMLDKITAQVISTEGTYTQDVEGNLVINTRDVVLKDMTIKGNLYLGEGIGDGDVTLENITVEGQMFVEGGGINSIKSKNSNYHNSVVVSATNPVRVVMDGDAVKIEALPGVEVTLTGNFAEVIVAPNVNMTIKDAVVETIVVEKPSEASKLNGAPTIMIDASAKVENVKADAQVDIRGEGKIENLIVNAANVIVEKAPTNVTITDKDNTVNIGGQDKDSASINKPSSGGGSSSGSGSNDDNNITTPAEKYYVKGNVSFEDEAVEFANVNLMEKSSGNNGFSHVSNIETDANGNFSFYAQSGKTYVVEAWITSEDNNGYHVSSQEFVLNKDTNLQLVLEQKYVANFVVTDEQGVAISDVKVRPVVDGREDGWSYTDNYGFAQRYLWDEEATYGFNLYYNDELIHQIDENTVITEGEYKLDFNVKLPVGLKNTIKGVVRNADGTPAANVTVNLYEREIRHAYGYSNNWLTSVTTNANGEYTFNVPDNKKIYHVEIYNKDKNENVYVSQKVEARFTEKEDLIVRQSYGINTKVVDKNGLPIHNAEVRVYHENGQSGRNTDYDGRAEFYGSYMTPGTHRVVVTVGSGNTAKVQVRLVTIQDGSYNYNEEFVFDNIEVSGRVVNVEIIGDEVQVGHSMIPVGEVAIRGNGWSEWARVRDGKAIVVIPEEFKDDKVQLDVYGNKGEVLYSEDNIDFAGKELNLKKDLTNLSRYTLKGNVSLKGTVTTASAISVELTGFDDQSTQVGTLNGTLSQDNLIETRYKVVANEIVNGIPYMVTEMIYVDADRTIELELKPVKKVIVEVIDDATGAVLPNVSVELNHNGLYSTVWTNQIASQNGRAEFIAGLNEGQRVWAHVRNDNKYTYRIIGDNETTVETGDTVLRLYVERMSK